MNNSKNWIGSWKYEFGLKVFAKNASCDQLFQVVEAFFSLVYSRFYDFW